MANEATQFFADNARTFLKKFILKNFIWLNRQRGVDDAELDAVRGELERVQARLAALETIVTDGKYELERELQRLEDAS